MSFPKRHVGTPLTAADYNGNLGYADLTALLASAETYSDYAEDDLIRVHAEGWTYKVAASDATDNHVTTAGGVKLYVQPAQDGFYPLQAFGAVADDTTDVYDALWTAIYRTPEETANIDLGVGRYYCSKTLYQKKRVHLRGAGGGAMNKLSLTRIRWPSETLGIWVQRTDGYAGRAIYSVGTVAAMTASTQNYGNYAVGAYLYAGTTDQIFEVVAAEAVTYDIETAGGLRVLEVPRTTIDAPDVFGYADSSVYENFELNGTARNTALTTAQRTAAGGPIIGGAAHGLFAQARIYARHVMFQNFAGCGAMIFADTSTKYSAPYVHGEASMSQMDYCVARSNGGNGFHFQGYDVNACVFRNLDAVYNGRWGLWDRSFLGNVHIGHHISANGDGGATWGNPDNTGCRIFYGDRYWTPNTEATEQQLVDTPPSTEVPTIWVDAHESNAGFGGTRQPTWQASQPVGTYFDGGSFKVFGPSAAHVLMYIYTERLQGPAVAADKTQCIGGVQGAGYKVGGSIRAAKGNELTAAKFTSSGIAGDDETGSQTSSRPNAFLGGNSNNIVGVNNLTGGGDYRFRSKDGVDLRWDYNNGDGSIAFEITGVSTTKKFGRATNVPHVMSFPFLGVGFEGNARLHTTQASAPTSSGRAKGEIVWNNNPAAGGFAGWICVTTGDPDTWKGFGAIES